MIASQLILAFLCLIRTSVTAQDKQATFCGEISGSEAQGAQGFFQMTFTPGNAAYTYHLDLSKFDFENAIGPDGLNTCSVENGLAWHIHSFWTDPDVLSAAGPAGCTSTGGHYDPNLACSSKSQSAATGCVALNRTAGAGYVYGCSTDAYSEGKFDYCETGDLSGKFGKAKESTSGSLVFKKTDPYTDVQPVYWANYLLPDDLGNVWTSVVFHCGDAAGTRLACAALTPLPLGQNQCPGSVPVPNYDSFSTVDWALMGIAAFVLLAGVYYKLAHGGRAGGKMSLYDAGARADAQLQRDCENKELLPH